MSGTWGLSQTSIGCSSSRRRPCLNGPPTMTSTMRLTSDACVRLLEQNPDIILAHTGPPLSMKKARSSPLKRRQEASSIQRLEGGIGRTSRALAIPRLPSTDFGRCSRARAGGPTCLASCVVKSCSKRLSCQISPAVIARCWQNWLCSAAFDVSDERLFLKRFHANVSWALSHEGTERLS